MMDTLLVRFMLTGARKFDLISCNFSHGGDSVVIRISLDEPEIPTNTRRKGVFLIQDVWKKVQ